MALENPNYVEDLDLNAPTFQDFQSEGDDHLRNLKRAIKQTFPGFSGRFARKRNVSSSESLVATDNGSMVRGTQTLTLEPSSASALGNGWMVFVRADGGTITISPPGSEKVNGADNWGIPSGYTGILFCDGTEFFGMLIYKDVPVSVPVFPSTTRMLFQQTTPPAGWTKVTTGTYGDSAIRITIDTVGTGGVDNFSTTFGSGKTTAGHATTLAQTAPHAHNVGVSTTVDTDRGAGSPSTSPGGNTGTDTQGGGQSHSHNLNNFNIKYTDVIIATKD